MASAAFSPAGPVVDPLLALVEQHMEAEDRHDIEATVATFADDCHYFVAPLQLRLEGREAIAGWYRDLFTAFPDFRTTDDRFYCCDEAEEAFVVHQATMEGTHLGLLQGWAGTGKRFAVPMLVRILMTPEGLMRAEEVYFDTTDMFTQLGILPPRDGFTERVLKRLHWAHMALRRLRPRRKGRGHRP